MSRCCRTGDPSHSRTRGARILLFDDAGRGTRAIGRLGEGPGEFANPRALIRLGGDTLLVPGRGNARWNWAYPDTGVVRSALMEYDAALMFGEDFPDALPRDRIVVVAFPRPRADDEGGVAWTSCTVIALGYGADPRRGTTSFPCVATVTVATRHRAQRRLDGRPLRLGRRGSFAVLDSATIVGYGDGYALRFQAPDGRVLAQLRVDHPRRLVAARMRESVIARELAVLERPDARRMVDPAESRRLAREQPFADSLPPYSAIMTSRDGTLWVVDAIAPTDTAWSATAFRADGAIDGRLHAAVRGRPTAFEGDRVAVRTEDADGIVLVRIHRSRPTAR